MSVAILVDNSQAATPTIADLRKALTAFVKSLDGIGPVAIISVADRPTILRDYTTDQKQLQDAVNRVFALPGSGATLLDAIVEVSQGLAKRETDRAAMVIVTGEHREFSNRHYRDVLEGLAKGGAMMHALVLTGPGGTALNDEARNRASVLDLGPKASGGTRDRRADQPGLRREAAGAGGHPQEPAPRGLRAAADADSAGEDRGVGHQARARPPAADRPEARPSK